MSCVVKWNFLIFKCLERNSRLLAYTKQITFRKIIVLNCLVWKGPTNAEKNHPYMYWPLRGSDPGREHVGPSLESHSCVLSLQETSRKHQRGHRHSGQDHRKKYQCLSLLPRGCQKGMQTWPHLSYFTQVGGRGGGAELFAMNKLL